MFSFVGVLNGSDPFSHQINLNVLKHFRSKPFPRELPSVALTASLNGRQPSNPVLRFMLKENLQLSVPAFFHLPELINVVLENICSRSLSYNFRLVSELLLKSMAPRRPFKS